mmetsp:Transcript_30891/g.68403  ORF Transcript_30891/g.68403 Transcript_30891/m.68403 type:complete len:109 (-) Transcript_30891:971-1297(-)
MTAPQVGVSGHMPQPTTCNHLPPAPAPSSSCECKVEHLAACAHPHIPSPTRDSCTRRLTNITHKSSLGHASSHDQAPTRCCYSCGAATISLRRSMASTARRCSSTCCA